VLSHNKSQTSLEVHLWGGGYEAAELQGARTRTFLRVCIPACAIPWPDWLTWEQLRQETEEIS